MKADDFEALARKAGLAKHGLGWTAWESQLERFVKLVEEHTIKALAQPEPIISPEIKGDKAEPVAYQWLGTSVIRKRIPKTAEADEWKPLYAAFSQHKPFTLQAKCSSCDQPLGGLGHIHTCSPQEWWPVFQRAELSDSEGGEE